MAEKAIDLRSDTVTRPSPGMREAMASATVGDDVFGEDPTVNLLQEVVARTLGKEAALYVPSGTMGNQTCVKVHTQPGDEVICERGAHVFNYETGGMAFLSNVQAHTIEGRRGVITVEQIKRAIRPSVYYMPKTRLICLENTHNRAGGTIYPLEVIRKISECAKNEKIRMHLDGALDDGVGPDDGDLGMIDHRRGHQPAERTQAGDRDRRTRKFLLRRLVVARRGGEAGNLPRAVPKIALLGVAHHGHQQAILRLRGDTRMNRLEAVDDARPVVE